jgi:hypothetical protein
MEAVVAACAVKPQQVIAQKRQFFVLAKRPDVAPGTRPSREVPAVHISNSSQITLEEASNP